MTTTNDAQGVCAGKTPHNSFNTIRCSMAILTTSTRYVVDTRSFFRKFIDAVIGNEFSGIRFVFHGNIFFNDTEYLVPAGKIKTGDILKSEKNVSYMVKNVFTTIVTMTDNKKTEVIDYISVESIENINHDQEQKLRSVGDGYFVIVGQTSNF